MIAASVAAAAPLGAQDMAETLEERTRANREGIASQERIDRISDATDGLLAEYRAANRQLDSLRTYNHQLHDLIDSQLAELSSLQEQIDEIELVGRAVAPLMLDMIDALENFVELDIPFLVDERRDRIAGLRELFKRADVTDAEKYRRIMEAYQIEAEYGRTIEAYRGTLAAAGPERTVDFLRVGRIALVYLTLDGQEAGAWDVERKVWSELPAGYRSGIQSGLRVARKQAAPEMIRIPLPPAQPAGEAG